MNSCAFCGRKNAEDSRFCIDCGKPLSSSTGSVVPATNVSIPKPTAAHRRPSPAPRRSGPEPAFAIVPPPRVQPSGATVNCGWCGNPIEAGLPYCAHCGRRSDAKLTTAASCKTCGSTVRESDTFCSTCGAPLNAPPVRPEGEVRTLVFTSRRREGAGARVAVLDENGEVRQVVPLTKGEMTVGRAQCDIAFADDVFLSPLHAQLIQRDGAIYVRDLGSCNRTWVFLDGAHTLADDELLLVGSQILAFRRIGFPGPMPQDADGTRRIGSLAPSPDVAVLSQLRADGSVRDSHHVSAGRTLTIGREMGDWTFPYDQTMSGRHAEIREEDGQFVIHDLGSRNGIAVAVRGDRQVKPGQRVLVGDQVLRLESV